MHTYTYIATYTIRAYTQHKHTIERQTDIHTQRDLKLIILVAYKGGAVTHYSLYGFTITLFSYSIIQYCVLNNHTLL